MSLYLLVLLVANMSSFIDFHTHTTTENTISIENLRASSPQQVVTGRYFSVGVHPWDVHPETLSQQWQYVQEIAVQSEILTIGETGLDRNRQADLTLQTVVFEQHCQLAEDLQKPLVIHCVRAFSELIQIRKRRKVSIPWIIHGFNANLAIAKLLMEYDFYFSLGSALLHPESNASQLLKIVPEDYFFLETDSQPVAIQSIYEATAGLLHKDIAHLQQEVFSRFRMLFSKQLSD